MRHRTGWEVTSGGHRSALNSFPPPTEAIVAVGVEHLAECTHDLLGGGCRRILVEKPGALDLQGLDRLADAAEETGASVHVAYNRRFYAAADKASEIIREDGGATSFFFSFTEWAHRIAPLEKGPGVKESWLLANSSHVIDLAFHLAGSPVQLRSEVGAKLDWHPAGAIFTGSGRTASGALFSYHADWLAPGRWGLEICTSSRRLVLTPIETLHAIAHGSVEKVPVEIDDDLERKFKPGLHSQDRAWLDDDRSDPRLCSLEHQRDMVRGPLATIRDGGSWSST